MEPALTLILEFSAPLTVKKYISAVHMVLGLWYLLQQPRRNKIASDSGSQCLTIIAMVITKQRKRVKAGSGGCFIFTGHLCVGRNMKEMTLKKNSKCSSPLALECI